MIYNDIRILDVVTVINIEDFTGIVHLNVFHGLHG